MKITKYVTSNTSNLTKDRTLPETYTGETLRLPARSVSTIVYDIDTDNTSVENALTDDSQDVWVFPNPVQRYEPVNISIPAHWTSSEKINIGIYSLDGRLVHSENMASGSNTGSILLPDAIQAGIYLININCMGTSYQQKLIVK